MRRQAVFTISAPARRAHLTSLSIFSTNVSEQISSLITSTIRTHIIKTSLRRISRMRATRLVISRGFPLEDGVARLHAVVVRRLGFQPDSADGHPACRKLRRGSLRQARSPPAETGLEAYPPAARSRKRFFSDNWNSCQSLVDLRTESFVKLNAARCSISPPTI